MPAISNQNLVHKTDCLLIKYNKINNQYIEYETDMNGFRQREMKKFCRLAEISYFCHSHQYFYPMARKKATQEIAFEVVVAYGCGLNVHKKEIVATVSRTDIESETRTFQ